MYSKPLDLSPEALCLGPLGLARGKCLGRTGRELLVAPLAQLPRAEAKLGGDIRQWLAALKEVLDGLRLDLTGKPPSGPSLGRSILLAYSGSLHSPQLRRGKSSLDNARKGGWSS